jgi:hypothetical protein
MPAVRGLEHHGAGRVSTTIMLMVLGFIPRENWSQLTTTARWHMPNAGSSRPWWPQDEPGAGAAQIEGERVYISRGRSGASSGR